MSHILLIKSDTRRIRIRLMRQEISILLVYMHNYMRKNICEYAQGSHLTLSIDVP